MSTNRISYTNKNFDDYQKSILNVSKNYYGDIFDNFNDASIGKWFIDVFSDIADNLSYHIDRAYQETNLETAQETSSLLSMARTQNIRVPGPKAALVEVELSCEVPLANNSGDLSSPDYNYAPIIRRGTLFSTGSQTFELMENVDFSEQFNQDGLSNRQIIPNRDSNGNIINYTLKKLSYALSGQSKVYKKVITDENIKPFMSILLQDKNILGVESILVKEGTNINTDPPINEYFVDDEDVNTYGNLSNNIPTQRFFEVENLSQQYRFGDAYEKTSEGYNPIYENIEIDGKTYHRITKGLWKRLKNKFITEYTNNWSLKIIFGAGIVNENGEIADSNQNFTKYMMSRMIANDYLGVLPKSGSTIYILYRVGGGNQSNIAQNSLKYINYLNYTIKGDCSNPSDSVKKKQVQNSISVTNPSPSYGGKDAPTDNEIKYLLKYKTGSFNRCVTLKDYQSKIIDLPAKYGTPFRSCAIEENNKVVIYCLGLDSNGKLTTELSETVTNNIKSYLSMYKMITDLVEFRSGKVVNLSFEIDAIIDKSYNSSEVAQLIIDKVKEYMDIKKHLMGEDIFIGSLEKEISLIDGVLNLIELRCYNKTGEGYGSEITQEIANTEYFDDAIDGYSVAETLEEEGSSLIDLKASDKILYSDTGTMFEIKYPETDIKVTLKTR